MKKSKNPIDEVLLMKLFKEYENTRSVSIRNEIIEMNLPFVDFTVKKLLKEIVVNNKLKSELKKELISIGNFGLIIAVETYDVDYGTTFSTYAAKCILNHIKKNLYTVTDIKIKRYNYPILNAIYRIEKYNNIKLEDHLDELDDILSECPFIDESIKEKVKKYLRSKSIEYSEEKISEGYEIEDTAIKNVLIEEMMNELECLPEKEREVLKHRYGFYGSIHTLDDLGNYMSCTHQNISVTEKKALGELKLKLKYRS